MKIIRGIIFVLLVSAWAHAQWHVENADIRFNIRTIESPTDKSAGYFVVLPDGGILPQTPVVRAFSKDGKEVKCYVMWHSRPNGLAVIMGDPDSYEGAEYIYVSEAQKSNIWTPNSGLTPSQLLASDSSVGNMNSARKLGELGPVGPDVHFFHNEEHERVALTIKGDLTGREPPVSCYLIVYLKNPKAGKVLLSPNLVDEGGKKQVMDNRRCIVELDGKPIERQKLSGKPFGNGEYRNLSEGPHQLDVYLAMNKDPNSAPGDGTMFMCWKTPADSITDLSSIKRKNWGEKDIPKEAAFASRPVWSSEIMRSGKAEVIGVAGRHGQPIAAFGHEALANYWINDSAKPLFVYKLNAFTGGNPKDTQYTWSFADGGTLKAPTIARFFPGFIEHKIALTAVSGKAKSHCVIPFYAYSPVETDMNDPDTRAAFRAAFLGMVKAIPVNDDPVRAWTPSMWKCFHEVQEFGKGQALLGEVMNERWKFFQRHMTQEQQWLLEDIYFQYVAHNDPDQAIKWLEGQAAKSPDPERRKELKVRLAEVYMYQKGDFEEAKKVATPLARGMGGGASRASIRLGDIAFLEGDLNEANRYWGTAQNQVNVTRDMAQGGIKWQTQDEINFEKAAAELETWGQDPVLRKQRLERKKQELKAKMAQDSKFTTAIRTGGSIENWKKSAVLDTAMASSIMSLMQQGYMTEAYRELLRWEKNFPLSKISGDYIIREADYYIKIGNIKRGRRLLEAYCENVDASGYLPQAAEKLLNLMIKAEEPDKKMVEFCEKMKKRFEFHPLAERMENMITIIKGGRIKGAVDMNKLEW